MLNTDTGVVNAILKNAGLITENIKDNILIIDSYNLSINNYLKNN